MAPVGRWQKGKDLHWYSKDKKGSASDAKEEIRRIKEEEEQAMREALGLAPKRAQRPQGNKLDKHEYSELIKRESTAEDLGAGHAEAAQVEGLGLYKGPNKFAQSISIMEGSRDNPSYALHKENSLPVLTAAPLPLEAKKTEETPKESVQDDKKKRRREERKYEKEKKHEKRDRKHSHNSDDKRHKKHKERRRHDSGSD